MVLFIFCVLSAILLFLNRIYCKRIRFLFSPSSIMVYLWLSLLLCAIVFGNAAGLYGVHLSVVFSVFFFLVIILLISLVLEKASLYGKSNNSKPLFALTKTGKKRLFVISIVFFAAFCFSTFFYFYCLKRYGITLFNVFSNYREWKTLILSGDFNESQILFLGRNIDAFGTIFSINFIMSPKKSHKRKISLLILIIYIALVLIYPRRDVFIAKLIYVGVPFLLICKFRIKKIIVPLGLTSILLLYLFSFISKSLSWGDFNFLRSLSSYTFGSFNSLQKAIDFGYEKNTDLLMGNTFYFVYMILKYINPSLKPPDIVLQFYSGDDSVNVYTSLIAPFIDSQGNILLFYLFIFAYAFYIGVIISLFFNIYRRLTNIISIIMLSTIYACVLRSFYNPVFSYADVLTSLIICFFLSLAFQETIFTTRLSKKYKKGIAR